MVNFSTYQENKLRKCWASHNCFRFSFYKTCYISKFYWLFFQKKLTYGYTLIKLSNMSQKSICVKKYWIFPYALNFWDIVSCVKSLETFGKKIVLIFSELPKFTINLYFSNRVGTHFSIFFPRFPNCLQVFKSTHFWVYF